MRLIEHFFQLLAPHECIVCEVEGSLLCPICSTRSLEVIPERCYRCNRLSPQHKTCAVCRHYSVLTHAWIRTSYNPVAKKVVHNLKFDFARDAAKIIAAEIYGVIPALPPETLLVHVPAATSHIRQRGFDQSALIARELARLSGLPHIHALARLGQQRQVGTTAKTRREQMKNAFRVVSAPNIKDAHILLVDDVLTTGSTAEAAGLTLRVAGAKSVAVTAFAQAK